MEVGLSLGHMVWGLKARLGELIVLTGEDVAEHADDNSRDNHTDHGEGEVHRIGGDEGRERGDGAKDKGSGDNLENAEERATAGTADNLSQEELLFLRSMPKSVGSMMAERQMVTAPVIAKLVELLVAGP